MITRLVCIVLSLTAVSHLRAQPPVPGNGERPLVTWLDGPGVPDDQEHKNDPGYSLYRKGYRSILEQKWDAAQKTFQELLTQHPESRYVDEAAYWSAYALKQTDYRKARDAYRAFTRAHRGSRYFDDAVADLEELEDQLRFLELREPSARHRDVEHSLRVRVHTDMRQQMKRLQEQIGEQERHARNIAAQGQEILTGELKVKIEALHALARRCSDEKAFQTLTDMARNRARSQLLRVVALQSLSKFEHFNVVPVATEIARTDSSPEIRSVAVYVIRETGRDRDTTVDILVELYNTTPQARKPERTNLLYSIADVGSDRAVDFLSDRAMNESDTDLRRTAIYCLGGIGGEKARTVLTRILRAD